MTRTVTAQNTMLCRMTDPLKGHRACSGMDHWKGTYTSHVGRIRHNNHDADLLVQVVEYLAYTLLSKYSVDSQIRDFVEKYDFYVFPIVNPDGMRRRILQDTFGPLAHTAQVSSIPTKIACGGKLDRKNLEVLVLVAMSIEIGPSIGMLLVDPRRILVLKISEDKGKAMHWKRKR